MVFPVWRHFSLLGVGGQKQLKTSTGIGANKSPFILNKATLLTGTVIHVGVC